MNTKLQWLAARHRSLDLRGAMKTFLQTKKNFPPFLPRAAPAATVDTLNNPPLFQFVLGHTADAVGRKIGVTGLKIVVMIHVLNFWSSHLDAAQAAEIFIALLLPFCNQVGICNLFLKIVSSDSSAKQG